jgi:thiamine biosynthesis lipoprotein
VAPDRPLISCLAPGRRVDLGGIGKGFALDQLAVTLASYQVESALLSAGASTLLAVGPKSWPIALTGDGVPERISLRACALGASGTGIQGAHVVHPDSPQADPPYLFKRVWVMAPTATAADAYATACLLMSNGEIEAFADLHRHQLVLYGEDLDRPSIRKVSA